MVTHDLFDRSSKSNNDIMISYTAHTVYPVRTGYWANCWFILGIIQQYQPSLLYPIPSGWVASDNFGWPIDSQLKILVAVNPWLPWQGPAYNPWLWTDLHSWRDAMKPAKLCSCGRQCFSPVFWLVVMLGNGCYSWDIAMMNNPRWVRELNPITTVFREFEWKDKDYWRVTRPTKNSFWCDNLYSVCGADAYYHLDVLAGWSLAGLSLVPFFWIRRT